MNNAHPLAREKALFRYTCALERGDFETVAIVLALAADDAELERMILEINAIYMTEQAQTQPATLLSSNGSYQKENPMTQATTLYPGYSSHNNRRALYPLTLVAAIATVLILCTMLFSMAFPFAPDSQPLASLTLDDLDPITGENVAELTQVASLGRGYIGDIVLAPDELTFAVSSPTGIYIHDASTLETLFQFGEGSSFAHLAYLEDGTLVQFSSNGIVRLWNPQSGELQAQYATPAGEGVTIITLTARVDHAIAIIGVCNSPIENTLNACQRTTLQPFRVSHDDIQELPAIELPPSNYEDVYNVWISKLEFSPDGTWMVVAETTSGYDPNIGNPYYQRTRLWVYETATGEQIYEVELQGYVNDIVFSPTTLIGFDGALFAVAHTSNANSTIALFTIEGTVVDMVRTASNGALATHLGFSEDGSLLYTGGYLYVRFWNVEDFGAMPRRRPLFSVEVAQLYLSAVEYFGDGKLLIGGNSGQLQLVDVTDALEQSANGEVVDSSAVPQLAVVHPYTSSVTEIEFTPGENERMAYATFGGAAWLWDVDLVLSADSPDGRQQLVLASDFDRSSIAFTADGNTLVYGGASFGPQRVSAISLIDVETNEITETRIGPDAEVSYNFTLNADDEIVTFDGGDVQSWDLQTGALGDLNVVVDTTLDSTYSPYNTIISPDARYLAGTQCIETEPAFNDHGDRYGNRCVVLQLDIIPLDEQSEEFHIETNFVDAFMTPVVFSEDSGRIAVLGCLELIELPYVVWQCQESGIKVWDLTTLDENNDPTLLWETETEGGPYGAMVFSPDGSMLVVSTYERPLRIYDTATGDEITTIDVPGTFVSAIAFSPDSKLLALGTGEGLVTLWGIVRE